METKQYDVYAVVVGMKYYADSKKMAVDSPVYITKGNVLLDGKTQIGSIAKQQYYYDLAAQYLEALSTNVIFNKNNYKHIVLTSKEEIDDLCGSPLNSEIISSGIVRYSDAEIALVWLGTVSIADTEDAREENADYDIELDDLDDLVELFGDLMDDEVITITEKGNDYLENNAKAEREEKSMNNIFGNLGFGKLNTNRYKLSMNGIAVAQGETGKYVVYNKDNNEFVDVTDSLFDIKDALFMLPTVEVAVGDVVLHNNKPYYIVDIATEIKAVSYEDCTQTVLIPKSTMFGLKYFTKIFSMFGDSFAQNGELFSNPLMLMTLMGGEGKGSNDLSKMLLFSTMSKGDLGTNPMMLAMMMGNKDGGDDLSSLAMMSMMTGGTNPFAPKPAAKNINKETKPAANRE